MMHRVEGQELPAPRCPLFWLALTKPVVGIYPERTFANIARIERSYSRFLESSFD